VRVRVYAEPNTTKDPATTYNEKKKSSDPSSYGARMRILFFLFFLSEVGTLIGEVSVIVRVGDMGVGTTAVDDDG
jgi:hypothetical protein